ncbi:MAG: histidine kinase [Defluviitaleaceae bacterium]|nr:histidine kinase [Defluviitaleaceae bacterium]
MNKLRLPQILIRNKQFRASFLKYFAGMAVVVLVVVIAYNIVLSNIYSLYLQDALYRYREQHIHMTGDFVSNIFERVNQAQFLITHNEDIAAVLTAAPELLPDIADYSEERLRQSDIHRAIGHLFYFTFLPPALHSVYIYGNANSHVLSWTDFRPFEDFHDRDFMYNRNIFVRTDMPGQNPSDMITARREIVRHGEIIGIAAFNIEYDRFAFYVAQELYGAPTIAAIADEDGIIFYAKNRSLLNTHMHAHYLYAASYNEATANGISVIYREGQVISAVRSVESITIVSTVESTTIAYFRGRFFRVVIIGGAIGLIGAFILAFGIALRLYGNMIRLVNMIGEGGSVKLPKDKAYVIESIASLTAHNRHIEHELAEKLTALKNAQVVVLQNQINPHFILNTLQLVSLNVLKTIKSDNDATRAIALLSEILQSNLNTADYMVPLKREIHQVIKYIEIQQMRLKERFNIDWDIPEELMTCQTVKFVIQPIVENCFKHGLMANGDKEKRIGITAARDGDALLLVITDNGKGMDAASFTNLQRKLSQSHMTENKHIGLCNVDKRIKLIFGERYGVTVDSELGIGTKITIRQKTVR